MKYELEELAHQLPEQRVLENRMGAHKGLSEPSSVLFHMPTASTLDSRSYLGSGSAELNIKMCIHAPERFTESKVLQDLSYCTAGETESQRICPFKV